MPRMLWRRIPSILILIMLFLGLFLTGPASEVQANRNLDFSPVAQEPLVRPVAGAPVAPADTTGLPPAATTVPRGQPQGDAAADLAGSFRLPKALSAVAPEEVDHTVQLDHGQANMPSPIVNFDGIHNIDGVLPPDTDGEIGKNHYIQMVNLSMAIYNKSGTLLYGPFRPSSLWPRNDVCGPDSIGNPRDDGDPIVLYDQLADRWLLSQFALPNYPSGPFYECIAVSKTGLPTNNPSDWHLYTFRVSDTKMNDYPKLSVWPDGYYMSVNQFAGNSWAGAGVFVFDRVKMLAGLSAGFQYLDLYAIDPNFGGMLPADLDGATLPPNGSPAYFLEVDDASFIGPSDALRIWEFHVDWNTPANSTFGLSGQPNAVLGVASFNLLPCVTSGSRSCIPQQSSAQKLDSLGDRLMFRAAYRNFGTHESIVLNHTVRADGTDRAGVRWYEVRDPGGSPAIYQQGTYAPADGHYRWMGSLAMDHVGNLALGYSISSNSLNPSIRYTGRLASDPLNTLPQTETTIITGGGAQTSSHARWGDYSAMSVDPVDDCTFWYTQQYIQTTGAASWRTRIASFKFPNCSILAQGTLQGVVSSATTAAGISGALVEASSGGSIIASTTTAADGSYSLALDAGSYSVTASAFGYQSVTVPNIAITADMVTVQNFTLSPVPTYQVSGTVTDAATGWPLYAQISIDGYPGDPLWTDPVTGAYNIGLVGGTSYTFDVTAWVSGYLPASQVVGPLSSNQTVNINLNADLDACTAPGYSKGIVLNERFEAGATPAGWTILDNTGGGVWAFNNPGERQNLTGGDGLFAIVDSDYYGFSAQQNTELRTSVIDLTGRSMVFLDFDTNFDVFSGWGVEVADVDVSTNSGSSWTNVWQKTQSSGDFQGHVKLDLSALAAGQAGVVARFHYYNANWDNWWQVDNVVMSTQSCSPLPGGLVVGNVADANTDQPLNDATVRNGSGGSTTSLPTVLDPAVPDGLYVLFSPAGQTTVSASKTGYASKHASASVPLNGAVRQDFKLEAGRLSFTPLSISENMPQGTTRTIPVVVSNDGNAAASFDLLELEGGQLTMGPFDRPVITVKPFKRHSATAEGLKLPAPPLAPVFPAGKVLQSWQASGVLRPWSTAIPGDRGTLWVSSPAAAWGGNSRLHEFDLNGDPTGRSWPYRYQPTHGPADAAYNWNTHTIWVAAVGDGDCIIEIDPELGETGRRVCPPVLEHSLRGLAYDPASDTWFAGGWADSMIYRFHPDGALISSVDVGLAVAGLAYNPTTQHLFVLLNASPNPVYVLDVANRYTRVGLFTIPGFGDYSGGGLELDCAGNLWAVNQMTGTIYQVESGESTDVCASDVSWLSASPLTATVPANSTVTVNVFLDSGQVSAGVHQAQLKFNHDTPYDVPNLPVSMDTSGQNAYGLLLTPASAARTGPAGATLEYRLSLTNTGSNADTFQITYAGNNPAWVVHLPQTSVNLLPGVSAEVIVQVTVPSDALNGDSDWVEITVTSQGDPTKSAAAELYSTASGYRVYLPYTRR